MYSMILDGKDIIVLLLYFDFLKSLQSGNLSAVIGETLAWVAKQLLRDCVTTMCYRTRGQGSKIRVHTMQIKYKC